MDFDACGNLAPGVHRIQVTEVLEKLGTGSARREFLGRKLAELLRVATESGLVRRVYLWGSFASAKPAPNDLDLLLVLRAGLTDEDLSGPLLDLVDHERARVRFTADVFWLREESETAIRLMLEAYSFDRARRARGVVEVIL